MTKYYYSADLLEQRGACAEWVRRFREVFGRGKVPLDLEFCKVLLANLFPVDWPVQGLVCEYEINGKEVTRRLRRVYLRTDPCNTPTELLANLTECAELWAEYHRGRK